MARQEPRIVRVCLPWLALSSLLLVFSACGGPTVTRGTWGSPPAWVTTGESPDHPADAYLVGFGTGMTPEGADDAARAEIARRFESERGPAGSTASQDLAAFLTGETAIRAAEGERVLALSRIEIVKRFSGSEGCYSLAALSRAGASDALHAQATALAMRAGRRWELARTTAEPLAAAREYYQIVLDLVRLRSVNAGLRLLGLRDPVSEPVTLGDAWKAFSERARRDCRVVLIVEGTEAAGLKFSLTEALAKRGLEVARERPRIEIRARCSARPVSRPPADWTFLALDFAFEARDTMRGNVVASLGPGTDEASGRAPDLARERAGFVIRTRLVEPFVNRLFDGLFGSLEQEGSSR